MAKFTYVVQDNEGIHARPAGILVKAIAKKTSDIKIKKAGDTREVNAKSIMGMMSLTLLPGEEITVVASGTDEKEAAAGIERFLVNVKNR